MELTTHGKQQNGGDGCCSGKTGTAGRGGFRYWNNDAAGGARTRPVGRRGGSAAVAWCCSTGVMLACCYCSEDAHMRMKGIDSSYPKGSRDQASRTETDPMRSCTGCGATSWRDARRAKVLCSRWSHGHCCSERWPCCCCLRGRGS